MKKYCLILHFIFTLITLSTAQDKVPLDTLLKQANNVSASGNIVEATRLLLEVQKVAELEKNERILCKMQLAMAKIGLISENNSGVEEALVQAQKHCSACGDSAGIARLYLMKSILYMKYNHPDSSIPWIKESARIYMNLQDTIAAANAKAKLGNVLERIGKYKEAQPYYLEYYEVAKKGKDLRAYLTSNIYLVGNYTYLLNAEKAAFHNNIVKELSRKQQANYEYAQALRYDATIAEVKGDYEAAFNAMIVYSHYYEDTLMNEQALKQSEEFKAKFESEKKENQIALQNAELSKANIRFWVLFGGLGLAILVGAILFGLTRQLRKRNREKEFLIKEIHHRVKNNLQILSSLLYLQSRKITDDAALDAVRAGQSRVDAIGLMHQKLYMGDNIAQIEMQDYLVQFGQNLMDAMGADENQIQIRYEMQPIYLDVDQAIPLGLIINELATNSIKYAFPDQQQGEITIALYWDAQKRLCLEVRDNGVGISSDQEQKNSTKFGAQLIEILSKKLNGKIETMQLEQGYGTRIVFEKWEK
ncbi:MAG: sensor histidine kinase [Saprospiraceae bacterium]|nr:sensor histidine kinase [Saprospiraceae bacterium]